MSWNFSISPVHRDQFAEAVKEAVPTGDVGKSGNADDVAAAKAALIALAARVKRGNIGAQASGHTLQPEEGDNWSDSLSVSVYGTN